MENWRKTKLFYTSVISVCVCSICSTTRQIDRHSHNNNNNNEDFSMTIRCFVCIVLKKERNGYGKVVSLLCLLLLNVTTKMIINIDHVALYNETKKIFQKYLHTKHKLTREPCPVESR